MTNPDPTDGGRWSPEITKSVCKRCAAPCCTDPNVTVILDREKAERRLKDYKYEVKAVRWRGKVPILKKNADGSCVYFDAGKGVCRIYKTRPAGCKAWFCGRGTAQDAIWRQLSGAEETEEAMIDGD